MPEQRVVIIGAGFAGLELAKKLNNKSGVKVTLIDKNNFYQFQPLFYQVATGRLDPSNISFPLRALFHRTKNVHIRVAEVKSIDEANNTVITNKGNFEYDKLVMATGCTSNYFGNKQVEQFAYPMKSTNEAVALQNKILLNFEESLTAKPEELEALNNIVVVGGGPTGVELSGALIEMKANILPRDYPDKSFANLQIFLLEGGPDLLGPMSDLAHKKSREYLENMGVKVMTGALLKEYDGNTVLLGDGQKIPTKTLVWAAGVMGNVLDGVKKEVVQRGFRISVDEFHKVKDTNNIYAIGDISVMETPDFPRGHAQLGNVAIKQGANLAKNIIAEINGGAANKFVYKSPGTMATVGKSKAVVDLPKYSFAGFFAWLTWMFVHLMLILGAKRKFWLFLRWMNSYFSNDSSLRLILLPTIKNRELAKSFEGKAEVVESNTTA